MSLTVTAEAERPARPDGTCYYCSQPVGANHEAGCVTVVRKAKVRATIEYEVEVPSYWTLDDFEFHRNEGTWCSSNIIEELQALDESGGCLCERTEFKFLGFTDAEPYVGDGG